jgi:hypothetical protein
MAVHTVVHMPVHAHADVRAGMHAIMHAVVHLVVRMDVHAVVHMDVHANTVVRAVVLTGFGRAPTRDDFRKLRSVACELINQYREVEATTRAQNHVGTRVNALVHT